MMQVTVRWYSKQRCHQEKWKLQEDHLYTTQHTHELTTTTTTTFYVHHLGSPSPSRDSGMQKSARDTERRNWFLELHRASQCLRLTYRTSCPSLGVLGTMPQKAVVGLSHYFQTIIPAGMDGSILPEADSSRSLQPAHLENENQNQMWSQRRTLSHQSLTLRTLASWCTAESPALL
eukprot:XP_017449349.1 PREDICTED: uncharacterized protein LOC108351048 isoform X2 [Rattus norvegicus]